MVGGERTHSCPCQNLFDSRSTVAWPAMKRCERCRASGRRSDLSARGFRENPGARNCSYVVVAVVRVGGSWPAGGDFLRAGRDQGSAGQNKHSPAESLTLRLLAPYRGQPSVKVKSEEPQSSSPDARSALRDLSNPYCLRPAEPGATSLSIRRPSSGAGSRTWLRST